jgi:WD40 repeat protein
VVTALAFSPIDDDLLVIATDKGTVRRCQAQTGTCLPPLPFAAPGSAGSSPPAGAEQVLGIGFSPDGRFLASISSREQIFLWRVNPEGAAEPVRLSRPWFANDRGEAGAKRTGGASVGFGRVEPRSGLVTVATASYLTDAMIWRWDPASGRVAGRPLVLVDPARRNQPRGQRSHSVGVTSLAFSSDSRLLITGAWDGTAKVWDVAPGLNRARLLSRIEGHQGPVRSVQFKPRDNKTVLTASSDGSSRLWRIDPEHRQAIPQTAALLEAFEGHRREVVTAVFSPAGDRMASASLDGSVRVWRIPGGEMPDILQGPVKVPGNRALVAIDRAGRLAASFSDGRTFIWPAATPIHHQALPPIPGLTSAAFDWQDQRLATVAGNSVEIWAIPMGERLRTLRIEGEPVTQVAFDPDGREFLTVSGASVRIWNANLWPADGRDRPSRALPDQPAPVVSAAYDRSGRRIITASEDGTARIWHAGRMQQLGPPLQHPAPVIAAAFAAAAGQAVTVTRDPPQPSTQGPVTGSIHLWDIKRNQIIDEISGLELNPGPGGPGLAVTTAANMDKIHVAVPGAGGELPRFWLWDRKPRSSVGEVLPAALTPGPVWPANARYALWLEENGGINLFRPDASESDLARLPAPPKGAPPKGDPLKAILVSPGTGTLGTISAKGIVRYLQIPSDDRLDLIDYAHLRAVLQPGLSAEERKRQGLQ